MKKNKILFILFILICSLFLPACNSDPKTFEKDEFSIVMPGNYRDGKAENIFFYLKKMDSGLTVIKETAEILKENNIIVNNLEEYVQVLIEKNKLEEFTAYNDDESNFYYYYYTRTDKKNEYFYLAVALKNQDDYFLCNFFCSESKKDDFKENFLEWAKTIRFVNN